MSTVIGSNPLSFGLNPTHPVQLSLINRILLLVEANEGLVKKKEKGLGLELEFELELELS